MLKVAQSKNQVIYHRGERRVRRVFRRFFNHRLHGLHKFCTLQFVLSVLICVYKLFFLLLVFFVSAFSVCSALKFNLLMPAMIALPILSPCLAKPEPTIERIIT